MMEPLRSLVDGVPQGRGHAAEQSGGPLAFGAGGATSAQGGGAPRDLRPAASGTGPLLGPWRSSPAPGPARWPSGRLYGRGPAGGTGEATLTPAWPAAPLAPC